MCVCVCVVCGGVQVVHVMTSHSHDGLLTSLETTAVSDGPCRAASSDAMQCSCRMVFPRPTSTTHIRVHILTSEEGELYC